MYYKKQPTKTLITGIKPMIGESIEQKIARILRDKAPITDGASRIFTERKDGVHPLTNIRSDRQELAIEATDYITASKRAKRTEKPDLEAIKGGKEDSTSGAGENTGTDSSKTTK